MKHKHDIADLANLIRRSPPLEFKFAGVEAGQFDGYASVFGNADSYGERVQRGAFAKSLADWTIENAFPPLLWSHDPSEPVGRIVELREDEKGLFLRGEFNLDTQAGRDAHAHVKAGDIGGMSIGFRVFEGGATKNADGTISLTAIDLMEVSLVAMPANRRARVTGVKSVHSREELERGLRGEIQLSLPRGAAAKMAPAAWAAIAGEDAPTTIDLDALAARIEATTHAVKSYR